MELLQKMRRNAGKLRQQLYPCFAVQVWRKMITMNKPFLTEFGYKDID